MFLLGHVGITVGLVEALRSRSAVLAALDYRWVAGGALLSDLVDKPLGHYVLGWGTGRLWGHTLLACLLLWGAFALLARRRGILAPAPLVAAALALGVTAHLAADLLWDAPEVLLWPLLGFALPRGDHSGFADWWSALLHSPFVQVTETLGLLALLWTAWRVHARGELPRYVPWLPKPRRVPVTVAEGPRSEQELPPQQR